MLVLVSVWLWVVIDRCFSIDINKLDSGRVDYLVFVVIWNNIICLLLSVLCVISGVLFCSLVMM